MENFILDVFLIYVFLLPYGQAASETISIPVERFKDVTLKCSVDEENYRKLSETVDWFILLSDGKAKTLTHGITEVAPFVDVLKPRKNDWNLKVVNVSEDNSGIYICKTKLGGNTTEIRRYNISIISKRNNDNDDKSATLVIETKPGKSEDMKCEINGYDPEIGKISWYKAPIDDKYSDEEPITGNTTLYTVLRENNVWILRAKIVNKSSGGLYICKYGDSIVANHEVKVEDDVQLLKPMYHKTQTLLCLLPDHITSDNLGRVQWKYNDRIPYDRTKYKVDTKGRSSSLTITRVAPSDSDGVYVCLFNNKPIEMCKFEIQVQRKPFVETDLTTKKTISFEENETANLTCVMLGRPEPEIVWYRKRRLPDAAWEEIGVQGSILLIPQIRRYAADEYICLGKNEHGEEEWNIRVTVNFGPEIDVMESEITLSREENIEISCLVQCSEKPTMTWYHNNTQVKSNYAYNPNSPSYLEGYSAYLMTLTLRTQANGVDIFKGTYECRARLRETSVSEQITAKVPEKMLKL